MDLPEFRAGMRLMASELNRLADQVRASRVISFVGGTVNQGPGGVSLVANPFPPRGAGSVVQLNFPFQVLGVAPEGEETAPKLKIYEESRLLEDPRGELAVFDAGSFQPFDFPELNSVIFIQIEFDEDMKPLHYKFRDTISTSGYWSSYPDPVERDSTATGVNYKRQKYLNIALAEVVLPNDTRDGTTYDVDGESRKVVQLVSTDLCMQWTVLAGFSARIAVPWTGASMLLPP
jgi:hypothetical protein